jgi:DNA-binding transcriptional ArsR family regulator
VTTEKAKKQIADELVAFLDSALFKTLSEPVRVQILKILLLNGRSDIGTIAEQMSQDRSVISRHLSLMRSVGILTCEKETRHTYYAIDALTFLEKVDGLAGKLRSCMQVCCPDGCRGD